MKPLIKLNRYNDHDVIITSNLIQGMSSQSYQLSIYDCGWNLIGTDKWNSVDSDFVYYDENGNEQITGLLSSTGWGYLRNCGLVDRWFHYNESTGKIQICNNASHHNTSN